MGVLLSEASHSNEGERKRTPRVPTVKAILHSYANGSNSVIAVAPGVTEPRRDPVNTLVGKGFGASATRGRAHNTSASGWRAVPITQLPWCPPGNRTLTQAWRPHAR